MGQPRSDHLRRCRFAEVPALSQRAAVAHQEAPLILRLDPLRERHHAEASSELDDGHNHTCRPLIRFDVANERAVDLEHLNGKVLQPRKRGVAGPEIVDGELDTMLV